MMRNIVKQIRPGREWTIVNKDVLSEIMFFLIYKFDFYPLQLDFDLSDLKI